MEDIDALGLLAKEIQCIRSIPNPPPGDDGIEKFCKITTEVISHAVDTTQKVARYGEEINAKLEEMQSALNQSAKKIEEQIKKAIDSIEGSFHEGRDEAQGPARAHAGTIAQINERFHEGRDEAQGPAGAHEGTIFRENGIVGTKSKLSSKEMEYMLLLQNLEMKKQRLDEFIIKTQQIMEKIKQGVSVTNSDIEQLRGCLESWVEDKKESYQEEQNRLANERNNGEKKESKVKENEQGKREDDEDREGKKKMKEDDERRKKEENERAKREEEERKRKADEEKTRNEEEDRIKKEEKERLKRETEEKQRNEEEMKQRKEMERKKKDEEERKKREAKNNEEEERSGKDPANWAPHTRSDGHQGTFHSGICCQVFATPETLQEEDLECLASDEWRDNEGPTLAIGEKVASSLIEVKVKEGDKDLKVPMRICVPHCSVSDSSDEVIVKASIDGGEWTNQQTVTVSAKQTSQPELNYAGIDVANFHIVKMLAVAKTRSQELLVDKSGISQASTLDKNIKLFVPRDTFHKPTKMKLEIRQIRDNSLSFATQYYDHCHNVLSTSSVMAITCEALTEKDIQLDFTTNAPNDKETSDKRTYLRLYKCRGDKWKIADSDMKGNYNVSIKLPSRKDAYVVLEIEGRLGIPNEEFLKAADELYFHSNASIVRVVAKQRADNPINLMIQCVRSDQVSSRLSELKRMGYSLGPDTSKEFALIDGQAIGVRCYGTFTMTPESEVKLIFHAFMDTAKEEVTLQDEYNQREFEGYVGYLQFEVLEDNREGALYINTSGNLPINLPKRKIEGPRAPILLPHYRSHRDMFHIRRRAYTQRKTPKNECEVILHDWMKSKPILEDKVKLILSALQNCNLSTLSGECEKLVNIHKKYLSDECMSEMAKKIANDWSSLARKLGLSEEDITSCKSGSKGSNEKEAFMMLCKWRVSEAVINSRLNIFNDLLGVLETVQNFNDLKEYVRHILNLISKD